MQVILPPFFILWSIIAIVSILSGVELYRTIISLIELIIIGASGLLLIRKKALPGMALLIFGAMVLASYSIIFNGGFYSTAFPAFYLLLVFTGWCFSFRTVLFVGSVHTALGALIVLLSHLNQLPQIETLPVITSFTVFSAFTIMLAIGASISNKLLHQALSDSQASLDKVAESEKKYRTTLDMLPIPVVVTEGLELAIFHNKAFAEHFGYTMEDLPTVQSWIDTVYGDDDYRDTVVAQWRKDVEEALKTGKQSTVRLHRIVAKDGTERFVEVSIRPLGTTMLHVLNDVTQRHYQEKKQDELKEQLYQSQKMEAVGQLAGGFAHDFNNMLGGIIGIAELLQEEVFSQNHRDYIGLILSAAEKGHAIVKKLNIFSRKDAKTSTTIDCRDIVHDTVELLKHSVNKNISITIGDNAQKTTLIGDD